MILPDPETAFLDKLLFERLVWEISQFVYLTSGQQVKDKSVCLFDLPLEFQCMLMLSGILWVAGILKSLPCFMALV